MEHGSRTVKNSLVIECEVEFIPLYQDQPLFGDIQVFLRSNGFVLHKLLDIAGRAFLPIKVNPKNSPFSQLLWADAVFVRDFTKLGDFDDTQLLKIATILHDVYRSYDIVRYFINEYDGRTSQSNVAKYDAILTSGRLPQTEFISLRDA